jgi:vacuolar iron transporter family protein
MANGLTVPFALAAGLSGTVSNTHLVVIAGLAEIEAGSIAIREKIVNELAIR